MMDLNGHEAGNGGYSQGKSKVHRVSSTRRQLNLTKNARLVDAAPALVFGSPRHTSDDEELASLGRCYDYQRAPSGGARDPNAD
jgi:hypothetical protein